MKYLWLLLILAGALTASSPALAQSDDEEEVIEEMIMVSARVTAGGAQDIAFARSEILSGRIPHPESFTDEGLLSQHDLTLPGADSCEQLFCVFGEANRSEIIARPNDRYFVGLGFSTDIDAEKWRREPVNIVAVVDKSGSMAGSPLELVKRSLLGLAGRLGKDDQLSIVLYGDTSSVHLEPTKLTRNNIGSVRDQIEAIESSGSTYMEEGLRVGYGVARETHAAFDGTTRLILFTDERPNVGDTSAEGFIGMAKAASQYGVGLTTIGVGVQFDSSLAVKISSTRGGNLFFLPDEEAADRIFIDELDYMVSELAHDLTFALRPHADLEITGVFGLPGELLSWGEDRAVTFTIPTVFLSSRGGGVFVSLGPRRDLQDLPAPTVAEGSNVLAAAITYVPARGEGGPQSSRADITVNQGAPSRPMQKASLLVDEYLALRHATTEHFIQNNQEAAYQALRALVGRFAAIGDRQIRKDLEQEIETVSELLAKFAFLSGHSSEVAPTKSSSLWGVWRITANDSEDPYGDFDLDVGDFILISPDNRMSWSDVEDLSDVSWAESDPFVMGKSALYFPGSDYLINYKQRKDKLTLKYRDREEDVNIRIEMQYVRDFPMSLYEPEDIDYLPE